MVISSVDAEIYSDARTGWLNERPHAHLTKRSDVRLRPPDRASAFHMQILLVDSSTPIALGCAPDSFCESVPACYDSPQ